MRLIEFLSATKQRHRIDELVDVSSPSFRQWFGKSKVVDKKGRPLMLFHGTTHPEKFDKLKGVSHFGTLKAADTYAWFQDPTAAAGPRIYPVYLRVLNPVRMYDSGRQHSAYIYAQDILRANRGNAALSSSLRALLRDWKEEAQGYGYTRNGIEDGRPWKGESRRMRHLIQVLERNGFDGIVYVNKEEHAGTTSWVTFHEDQVKYAYAESAPVIAEWPTLHKGKEHYDLIDELVDVSSPGFRQWFGKSKVIDQHGRPMMVYHGSRAAKEFAGLRGLSHFGTLAAASHVLGKSELLSPLEPPRGDVGGSRVYPVYLRIEHPVWMTDTGEQHGPTHLLEAIYLYAVEHSNEKLADALNELRNDWEEVYGDPEYAPDEGPRLRQLIKLLRSLGYDGIVYRNIEEDPGSVSWVPFSKKQIRYVYAEAAGSTPNPNSIGRGTGWITADGSRLISLPASGEHASLIRSHWAEMGIPEKIAKNAYDVYYGPAQRAAYSKGWIRWYTAAWMQSAVMVSAPPRVLAQAYPAVERLVRMYRPDLAVLDVIDTTQKQGRGGVEESRVFNASDMQAMDKWLRSLASRPIKEAREAPLYHWMSPAKAFEAIHSDALYPTWEHILPASEGGKPVLGTSMSRNPHFNLRRSVRLTFDQGKLAETNRIIPVDADYVYTYATWRRNPKAVDISNLDQTRTRQFRSRYPSDLSAEEFVLGAIKPLHKYLLAIDMDVSSISPSRETLPNDVEVYARKHGIPLRQGPHWQFGGRGKRRA